MVGELCDTVWARSLSFIYSLEVFVKMESDGMPVFHIASLLSISSG